MLFESSIRLKECVKGTKIKQQTAQLPCNRKKMVKKNKNYLIEDIILKNRNENGANENDIQK